jgi:hypothetical protein
MKKKMIILMMSLSLTLVATGLLAADGDLRVNGNVGVGTAPSPYPDVKLQVLGKTWLGNNVATGGNYSTSVGDSNTNYVPSGGNWNYTFLLNGLNTSSIGFHDAGHSVGSIRYTGNLFTFGGNDGWGNANSYFPGNVGVGTSTPGANLEINGSGGNTLRFRLWGSTNYWDLFSNTDNGGPELDDTFVFRYNGNVVAKVLTNGTWYGPLSDLSLKENITLLDNPVEKIKMINGINFNYKNQDLFPGRQVGVIADEVEKVVPEAVITNEDGNKMISYGSLIPLLIEAVKEQQKEIEALKLELSAIKR